MLRRLIVIQGDTEPASVEQQRYLGKTAPSLYDMRNLFQVNVEEGRHLWAMVYLLQKYFGRDGREEAEQLLRRRSGSDDSPRMLGAFNEETPDWLSFFMFTFFTDRDGKMQLESLAQSGFDPLSRTCRFMLTEEAFHMFVGENGVSRIVERTCEAMPGGNRGSLRHRSGAGAGSDRPAHHPEEDEPALLVDARPVRLRALDQRGDFFNAGLKGRFKEVDLDRRRPPAHDRYLRRAPASRRPPGDGPEPRSTRSTRACATTSATIATSASSAGTRSSSPAASPSRCACPTSRSIARSACSPDTHTTPTGEMLSEDEWKRRSGEWLPSPDDKAFIESLMKPEWAPGKYANWIAEPKTKIDRKPGDFEWVKLAAA